MASYKVTIETVNKEVYQAALSGRLPREQAHGLRERMLEKRKRHGIGMAVSAVVFLISIMIFLGPLEVSENMGTVIGLCLIFSLSIALHQLNKFYVAAKYLGALNKGYPELYS